MSASGRVNIRVLSFFALAVLLAAVLFLYTLRQRRPPIPADRDHLRAVTPDACLTCHGPGKPDARGPNHPLNDQCFSCHDRG